VLEIELVCILSELTDEGTSITPAIGFVSVETGDLDEVIEQTSIPRIVHEAVTCAGTNDWSKGVGTCCLGELKWDVWAID